jgi:endonuclease/exonuclease/phosphatase family metal-dependent hydrolase
MVSFKKPKFSFTFSLDEEIAHLRENKAYRGIPAKSDDRLLICTWNIANLGLHERSDDHYQLIAEVLSWFDICAIQEVNDDLTGLYRLETYIGAEYELLFSDRGGNDERSAYCYDTGKVTHQAMIGELAIPPAEHRWINIAGIDRPFIGFDRNPFIATFQFRNTVFMLVNAHLFFGSDAREDEERRALEAYAVGRYADLRRDDIHAFTKNNIALGDFNIPKAEPGNPIYDALAKRGLVLPEHSTRLGSSISTDAQYDQIAFFPSLKRKIQDSGVFDYDRNLFPRLWEQGTKSDFMDYCRYYISDHRPMWLQLAFD